MNDDLKKGVLVTSFVRACTLIDIPQCYFSLRCHVERTLSQYLVVERYIVVSLLTLRDKHTEIKTVIEITMMQIKKRQKSLLGIIGDSLSMVLGSSSYRN